MRIVKYYHRFLSEVSYSSDFFFFSQVDLSCLVSTIRWYHEMENGTEILIKVKHKSPYSTFIEIV